MNVANERQKVQISVIKTDSETKKVLEGAVFGLFTKEDIVNADGKVIVSKDFDYEEEFYIIRKEIRDKYVTDTMQRSKFQPCLLRYDRDRGYQLYSPSKSRIKQSIYLNKLGCALDTFLLNRDIQMIQFVTNLPEDYFSKE